MGGLTGPWQGAFRDLPVQHGFTDLRVEGRLPPELRGTLYRNGPSLFSVGSEAYQHYFDADGAVSAVRLDAGRAQGACRVVDTRWLRAERAAGHHLYRSYAQLGVGWRRWLTLPKNQANINVLPWNGRLFALWEAGRPIELDPADLTTRGETDLGGVVRRTLCAHPHPLGEDTFAFGVRYGARFAMDLYRLGPGGASRLGAFPLARPTLVHDFIPTGRHLVFFLPPLHLQIGRLLTGRGSFIEDLWYRPELGTEVVVVPLSDPSRPTRFTVPAFFLWHFVAGWEEGERLVVDYLPYEDHATDRWFGRLPWDAPSLPPPSPWRRAVIDVAAGRMETMEIAPGRLEFPAALPEPGGGRPRHAYALSFDPAHGPGLPPALVALDPATGAARVAPVGEGVLPSEPVLVPRAGGRAPWVLSLCYDGGRDASFLAVFDADRLEDGPVARAWFDHPLPFSLHGAFAGAG